MIENIRANRVCGFWFITVILCTKEKIVKLLHIINRITICRTICRVGLHRVCGKINERIFCTAKVFSRRQQPIGPRHIFTKCARLKI